MEFSGIISEQAIVYLADKLTSGNGFVTLDVRFGPALDRFRSKSDALAAARRRKAVAEQIASAIEERLRLPLADILGEGAASPEPDLVISRVIGDRS
jgi:hypothetical protein